MDLEVLYLNSEESSVGGVISSWFTSIYFQENETLGESSFEEVIILPPKFPDRLEVEIILAINDKPICEYPLLSRKVVNNLLSGCKKVWETKLNYAMDVKLGDSVSFLLNCNVCTVNKVQTLLEEPISKFRGLGKEIRLLYLSKIKIWGNFYCSDESYQFELERLFNKVELQINEYLGSLLVSQLEINFPICFSKTIREYLLVNILEIPQVSYFLSDSSKLIPYLMTILENDTTFKTIYKILTHRKTKHDDDNLMYLKFSTD